MLQFISTGKTKCFHCFILFPSENLDIRTSKIKPKSLEFLRCVEHKCLSFVVSLVCVEVSCGWLTLNCHVLTSLWGEMCSWYQYQFIHSCWPYIFNIFGYIKYNVNHSPVLWYHSWDPIVCIFHSEQIVREASRRMLSCLSFQALSREMKCADA